MATDFTQVKGSGASETAYLKIDSNGGTIVQTGIAVTKLTVDTLQAMADFRKKFEYAKALREIRYRRFPNAKLSLISNNDEEVQVIDFILDSANDTPSLEINTISLTDAATKKSRIDVGTTTKIFSMMTQAGFVSTLPTVKDITYCKVLPNETSAQKGKVYRWKKEYYVLNAAEDGYDKITGTFKAVKDLPAFTCDAKEGVIYNLTARFVSKWEEVFEPGTYTYTAATNTWTYSDVIVERIKRLVDVENADPKVIYVLTREDKENNRAKGSAWKVEGGEYVKETKEIISGTTLPFVPLAEDKVYYAVTDQTLKQANKTTKSWKKIGEIIDVRQDENLPDTSRVVLKEGTVYVLTEDVDATKVRGSMWMYNFTTKEFEAYSDEPKTQSTTPDSSSSTPSSGGSSQTPSTPTTPTPDAGAGEGSTDGPGADLGG